MKRQRDAPSIRERSGAEQPAPVSYRGPAPRPSTSSDDTVDPATAAASLRVYACLEGSVATANSAVYRSWQEQNSAYGRRTPSHVVGHISGAIRFAFKCSAEQPAIDDQRQVPFNVLVGWLESKAEYHDVDVHDVKELLCQLIGAEHRLYRYKEIVARANDLPLEKLTAENRADKKVRREIFTLVEAATQTAKRNLIGCVTGQSDRALT